MGMSAPAIRAQRALIARMTKSTVVAYRKTVTKLVFDWGKCSCRLMISVSIAMTTGKHFLPRKTMTTAREVMVSTCVQWLITVVQDMRAWAGPSAANSNRFSYVKRKCV